MADLTQMDLRMLWATLFATLPRRAMSIESLRFEIDAWMAFEFR